GEPGAAVVAARGAGNGELQIVVARKIPLHVHDQDHVVFVERGTGVARIENAAGAIEARPGKPGGNTQLPPCYKHSLTKNGGGGSRAARRHYAEPRSPEILRVNFSLPGGEGGEARSAETGGAKWIRAHPGTELAVELFLARTPPGCSLREQPPSPKRGGIPR